MVFWHLVSLYHITDPLKVDDAQAYRQVRNGSGAPGRIKRYVGFFFIIWFQNDIVSILTRQLNR
jgi:hypothetical protein